MCSFRYCSSFAPVFFLFFWAIVVFWETLTFYFYFFDIFFTSEHKRSNHRKYELKQVKGVACGNFRRSGQNRQKPCDHKKRILWPLFDQNKNLWPWQNGGWTDPNFFLIDSDIWNVEIRVRMRKLDQFYELTPIRRQNGNNARKICHGSKDLMETMEKTHELDSNTT